MDVFWGNAEMHLKILFIVVFQKLINFRKKKKSTKPKMSDNKELTLEETNRMREAIGLKPLAPRINKKLTYNDEVRSSFAHKQRHDGHQNDRNENDRARHNDNIDYHREDVPDRPREIPNNSRPKTQSNVKEIINPMMRNQHVGDDDPNVKRDEWGRILSTTTNIADEKQAERIKHKLEVMKEKRKLENKLTGYRSVLKW